MRGIFYMIFHCFHICPCVCLKLFYHHFLSVISYIYIYIYLRQIYGLFPLFLYSLRWVQIFENIEAWRSHSLVYKLHYIIIIIMQTDLSEGIEYIKCLAQILNSLNHILCNIWGSVFSAYQFRLWWFWECVLCLITIINSEVWTISHCWRFTVPTWGPSGADRTQVGPMLAPWTLLSGMRCMSWCAPIEVIATLMYPDFIVIWIINYFDSGWSPRWRVFTQNNAIDVKIILWTFPRKSDISFWPTLIGLSLLHY